jgi:hypothetical protein
MGGESSHCQVAELVCRRECQVAICGVALVAPWLVPGAGSQFATRLRMVAGHLATTYLAIGVGLRWHRICRHTPALLSSRKGGGRSQQRSGRVDSRRVSSGKRKTGAGGPSSGHRNACRSLSAGQQGRSSRAAGSGPARLVGGLLRSSLGQGARSGGRPLALPPAAPGQRG